MTAARPGDGAKISPEHVNPDFVARLTFAPAPSHGLRVRRPCSRPRSQQARGPLQQIQGNSITYRIGVGPQQGRKVFTLQTLPARDPDEPTTNAVGKVAGISLHAGVTAQAHQRDKLERLCRYVARPAVSEKRLSQTSQGKVCYLLKTTYRDGTTHVLFEPLDFIARLAALVPKSRVNLTRHHGVFAPNSHLRAQVIPAQRGRRTPILSVVEGGEETDTTVAGGHAAMTPDRVRGRLWAQRLKRAFKTDIETCDHCGGAVKIIACIRLHGCRR